jgi:CRISPR-associated endonuclease Cas3-HD
MSLGGIMNYLAKSTGETFIEHTTNVMNSIEKVVNLFDLKNSYKKELIQLAKISALLHDIGKLTNINQDILVNNSGVCRHAYISYLVAQDIFSDRSLKRNINLTNIQNTILYAVLFHHELKVDELASVEKQQSFTIPEDIEDYLITQLIELLDFNFKTVDTHTAFKFTIQQTECNDSSVDVFAMRNYVLTTLIAADRLASSHDDSLFDNVLKTNDVNYTIDNERTQDQNNLVKQLANIPNVINADPGAGKTSIMLQYIADKGLRSFVMLPKRIFIDGLYNTIDEDKQRLQLKLSHQKLHSGLVVSEDEEGVFESDINITSFDRILSAHYKRKQYSDMLKIHTSTIVVDEFHEFMDLERMIFPLQVFVRMRQMRNDSRLLLLSGTANKALVSILGNVNVVERTALIPHNNSIFTLEFNNELRSTQTNYLVFSNRVKDTQNNANNVVAVLHSMFSEPDREEQRNTLFSKAGKNNRDNSIRLSASQLATASLNYSVAHMDVEICKADTFAQLLGRRDRFNQFSESVVRVREDVSMIEDKKFPFAPKKHLVAFYNHLRTLEGQQLTHREFMVKAYDEFFNKQSNVTELVKDLTSKKKSGIESLEDFYPQYFEPVVTEKKFTSSSFSLRGDSYLAIAFCPERNEWEVFSTSELDNEYVAKVEKSSAKRKELSAICEKAGFMNAYKHQNIKIGNNENPIVMKGAYDIHLGYIKPV